MVTGVLKRLKEVISSAAAAADTPLIRKTGIRLGARIVFPRNAITRN